MLVLRGWATGANRDRELNCEVVANSAPRNFRSHGRWRANLRRSFARAVCYGLDRTLCCENLARIAPASSEFHGLPFHPSRLAMFAVPFLDRGPRGRPGPD